MLIKKMITGFLLLTATSVFASTDWTTTYANANRTSSLPINTHPEKYHVAWQYSFVPDEASFYSTHGMVVAENNLYFMLDTQNVENYIVDKLLAINTDNGELSWQKSGDDYLLGIYYQAGRIFTIIRHYNERRNHHERSRRLEIYRHPVRRVAYTTSNQYSQKALNEKVSMMKSNEFLLALSPQTGQIIYESPLLLYPYSMLMDGESTAYFQLDNVTLGVFDTRLGIITSQIKITPGRHFGSIFSFDNENMISKIFDGFLVIDRKNPKISYKVWLDNTAESYNNPAMIDVNFNTAIALFADDDLENSGSKKGQATMVALDLVTHQIKWKYPLQNEKIMPALINDFVFSVQVDYSSLNSIDSITGQFAWSWHTPTDDALYEDTKIVATNDVVFVSSKKRVYAISQTTHQTVWQFNHSSYSLALGPDKLYMLSDSDATQAKPLLTAVSLS